MQSDFSIIEGPYLRDILDQPRALEETLTGLEVSETLQALVSRLQKEFKIVVLTGMGSSSTLSIHSPWSLASMA